MKIHVKLVLFLTVALVSAPLPVTAEQARTPEVPQAIAQLVIDHQSLEPYFHPEVPGRVPLVVSDHLLDPGLLLTKFGQPAIIKPDPQLTTGPFLRFEDITVLSDVAIVRIAYPVEGLIGRFILTCQGGGPCEVRVADVWER